MKQSILNLKNTLTLVLVLVLITLDFTAQSQCGGVATFADTRDSKVYSMVQIDGSNGPYCAGTSQCWMSENLNYGTRINGTINQSNNATPERYCYDDLEANCDNFGGLYQWDEIMNYGSSVGGNGPGPQGICPDGWHIPTDNEWKCLEMNLVPGLTQAQADACCWRGTTQGDQLKMAGTCEGRAACGQSNFDALLNGSRTTAGSYASMGNYTRFLTATENDATNSIVRDLAFASANSFIGYSIIQKTLGNSLRCVRDNAPIPLPIELLYFKAKWTNDQFETVTLDWETITESENSHFEIERSIDAVNFEYVKTVPGYGTSEENIIYSELDETPYKDGPSYYRLKQVDNNGDFEYSNIEALNIPEGLNLINLYPNPMVNELTVLLTSSENSETTINIKNNIGQTVRVFNQSIDKGLNTLNFDFSKLSTGNYIIEVSTTNGMYKVERKFIKSKQ